MAASFDMHKTAATETGHPNLTTNIWEISFSCASSLSPTHSSMASTDSNPLAATASTSAIKRTAPESPKNTSDATTGGDSDGGVDVDSNVKGDGVGGDVKESLKA